MLNFRPHEIIVVLYCSHCCGRTERLPVVRWLGRQYGKRFVSDELVKHLYWKPIALRRRTAQNCASVVMRPARSTTRRPIAEHRAPP